MLAQCDATLKTNVCLIEQARPGEQGGGDRTTSVYDRTRLIASIDGNGNRSTTVFDAAGQNIAQINTLGDRTTTVYDAVGQAISLIDERAHRFSFTYDAAGNMTEVRDSEGTLVKKATFNARNQPLTMADGNG
ncbi:MAG: hypothetical protein ACF8TS_10890, partial [Maioricimonas sp. JB049]